MSRTSEFSKTWRILSRLLLFVGAIAFLVWMFPSENKFRYAYQLGKPWHYSLLTAPFDFYVHKSADELRHEQDSVSRTLLPYYVDDESIFPTVRSRVVQSCFHNTDADSTLRPYRDYVLRALAHIYSTGVIPSADLDDLRNHKQRQILVVRRRTSAPVSVSEVYTPKQAYNTLISGMPSGLDLHTLKSLRLDRFLLESLSFDKQKTDDARRDALNAVTDVVGYKLAGEKIIDKGEILTPKAFRELESLRHESEGRQLTGSRYYLLLLGQTLVIAFLVLSLFGYFYFFRTRIFKHFSHILFVVLLLLLILSLVALERRFFPNHSIYLIPFALLPILLSTFFDARTAFFTHLVTILLAAFWADSPFEFILMQSAVGVVVSFSHKDIVQRSQLIRTILFVLLTYVTIYVAYTLITGASLDFSLYRTLIYLVASSLFLLLAYGLIYICEHYFGFLSNMSLIELSNVNNRLLMKFSETAPGTFQHCLQVANLASAAASRIGANALLVRTGALYHDIGKISHPEYFTENQGEGNNPLSKMSYIEAASHVIAHVADGVRLAEKNDLPPRIIDFIRTHHADSHTRYFYNSYRNAHPDEPVPDEAFRYAGPKPFSKEMAILMMADAVEAASRSLAEYTESTISSLVERIIDGQIAEGSFKNSPITFQHIETIKSVFKQKLLTIYHSRIRYPELSEAAQQSQGA